MDLAGKVVWITGASAGIGAAVARAAAARGARLILSARREDQLEAVRATCRDPDAHLVLPLDLAAPDTFAAAVAEVLAARGAIDVLIHNGGVSQRSLARDTALEVDRRIMAVNFFGAVALTKAVLPAMRERGAGRIVVVTSLVGKIGTPKRSTYAASKHALHGFFDSLRAEEWRSGIGVTLVCPGFIRTDISVNALTGDGSAQGTLDHAQAHGLPPELCAERILRAIEKEKDEVLIGGKERWAVPLKRFFPGLFNRVIRRVKVT